MEVSIVLGVGMLLTIMGFVLLALFLGVLVFALFMVYKGVKESKQYKNVALPGLMNSKSNTNKIDEDSIESLDLNSYKADEDEKIQAVASVPTGPAMPMPSPIPMPSPSKSTNASVPGKSPSSDGDQQSKGMTSVDPGNTHDDDDTDPDPNPDSIGLPTFSIPESDKGTGVDSMMSALNDFSFDSTRSTTLPSDEPNNDTINNGDSTASDTPSVTLPTLTAPSLDNETTNESITAINPFRPIS